MLKPPRKEEQELIDGAMVRAQNLLQHMLAGDMETAMQQLHTDDAKKKRPHKKKAPEA